MTRKNPDNKPLRIKRREWTNSYTPKGAIGSDRDKYWQNYGLVLSNLAVAQSNLVKAGKDSALPHFIAIVKELEELYGFSFDIHDE